MWEWEAPGELRSSALPQASSPNESPLGLRQLSSSKTRKTQHPQFSGICPKETKTCALQRDLCKLFPVALLVTAPHRKQSRCQWASGDTEQFIQIMKHHSAERAMTAQKNLRSPHGEKRLPSEYTPHESTYTRFKRQERGGGGWLGGWCIHSSILRTLVLMPSAHVKARHCSVSLRAPVLRVQRQEDPKPWCSASLAPVMTPGLVRNPASNNEVQRKRRWWHRMAASGLHMCTHVQAHPLTPHTHAHTYKEQAKVSYGENDPILVA